MTEQQTERTRVVVDDVIIPGPVPLAATVRLPVGLRVPGPALVLTGPFTGVKEQVTGTYADALAAEGFVTLAFDHRNFGASGGSPRQHEDSAGKLEDLRYATSYLAARDEVDADRLGSVGVCLGGGYALRHAAFDPRIKAVAMVAAAFNSPQAMRDGMGAQHYRDLMATFADVEQSEFESGEVDLIPVVSADGGDVAMPGREPFEYYGTTRGQADGWHNQVTRLSIRSLLTLDAALGADFLAATPGLVVHGRVDDYCSPDAAQAIFERLTGPKDLVWLDTSSHIDLYDDPDLVGQAVAAVRDWLVRHLLAQAPSAPAVT